MLAVLTRHMRQRSRTVPAQLEGSLPRMMGGWMMLVALACAARIAVSPLDGAISPSSLLAFALLAAAPVASALMALRWFAEPATPAPSPSARWRSIDPAVARRHPLFGASGIMASLMVGLLLAIVLRGAEYLVSLPAVSADAPAWLSGLHFAMTADVVIFNALYAIAFIAALRHAPVFPLLMAAIWSADIVMQVGTLHWVGQHPDIPAEVGTALAALLEGNIKKVLISVALWLPYLLFSTRVNLTFRHRLPRGPVPDREALPASRSRKIKDLATADGSIR